MDFSLPKLPPRRRDSHKGDFGRVMIIGGSAAMPGAPALSALAALRSGAGLVQVACPPEIRQTVVTLVPCATTCMLQEYALFQPTVRAVGPGCGRQLTLDDLKIILQDHNSPLVLDADGLNALAQIENWWMHTWENVVLTPHPGEMKRLLATTTIDPSGSRSDTVRELSRLCHAIVVLKGFETVVSNGVEEYINTTGNPGMATAGSGDVLTGVIAALIGQGLAPYPAACLGVYLHGLAGDLAVQVKGHVSLIATDIIESLPDAFLRYDRISD